MPSTQSEPTVPEPSSQSQSETLSQKEALSSLVLDTSTRESAPSDTVTGVSLAGTPLAVPAADLSVTYPSVSYAHVSIVFA